MLRKRRSPVLPTGVNGLPPILIAKFEPDIDLDGLSSEQVIDKVTNPLLADSDGDVLTYRFELYANPGLTVLFASAEEIAQGIGITRWPVPVSLTENTVYFWRARAIDAHGLASGWMNTASFFVNTTNEPPSAPVIQSPADQAEIATCSRY